MKVINLNKRQEFIQELFINSRHLRYAFLKYFYPTQYKIPASSDLDILVDGRELSQWKALIQDSSYVDRANFRKKSFALFAEIFFEDGTFLEIDLIFSCKWKFHVFLPAEEMLDSANLNIEGIKIANLSHSFAYLSMFYTLNSCPIPEKYQEFYRKLPKAKQSEIAQFLEQTYQLGNLGDEPFNLSPHREQIIQTIKSFPENKGSSGVLLKLKSLTDRITDPGITITFSGVDGAGKSTILEKTRQLLTQKYRKEVVLLRQRPSILPILSAYKYGKKGAELRAAKTLPRTGNNKSRLSSLLRFMYYYLDYVLGQFYVFVQVNLKGHILLYDRYYFDFIVDSKRANIVLSPKLIRKLYRLVFKPQLNFLLYADPEVILARKQELSAEDIQELTRNFRQLFELFNSKYPKSKHIEINNLDMDETMTLIENAYQHAVSKTQ